MPRTCKEGAISTGLIFPITHRVPGTGTLLPVLLQYKFQHLLGIGMSYLQRFELRRVHWRYRGESKKSLNYNPLSLSRVPGIHCPMLSDLTLVESSNLT